MGATSGRVADRGGRETEKRAGGRAFDLSLDVPTA